VKFDIIVGTVVTDTHPQHKTMPFILKSLFAQKHLGDVYVCEDGKSQEMPRALKGFNVKHLTQHGPRFRLARNINMGLLRAKRPVVCFMGDSIPKHDLLKQYASVFEPDRIFTGVRYEVKKPGGKVVKKDWRMDNSYFNIDTTRRPWRRFTGNNWCASNKLLKSVNGWNEEYEGYGLEDFEFALRCYKTGYRFTPVPKAVVYHVIHAKRGENEQNQLRWFQTEGEFLRKAGLNANQS